MLPLVKLIHCISEGMEDEEAVLICGVVEGETRARSSQRSRICTTRPQEPQQSQ